MFQKLILTIFLAIGTAAMVGAQAIKTVTYEVTAKNLSLKAVDSYPQKLVRVEKEDSIYRIVVNTFAAYDDTARRKVAQADVYAARKSYPREAVRYLRPTSLTDFRHPEIRRVVDSVLALKENPLTLEVIRNLLKYSSRRIKFDKELAMELDAGRCTTLPVKDILERGKGTCSEYTNLFIALVRRVGIPCRMAVGYVYIPENNFRGSHAWAECYIKGYGWLAVDPQNGFYWWPPVAVKLFHGRDFLDCKIRTLPDMYPVEIKIINRDDATTKLSK